MLVARRNTSFALITAFALATLAVSGARAEDSAPNSRMGGPLGWVFASAPRAAHPWHKWGEFTFSGGAGWSQYQDHTKANDDGSLSAIDAKDSDVAWHFETGFAGRYVGAEIGYRDLGSSKFDAVSAGGTSWLAGDVSAKVEGTGWSYSAFARIPVMPRWVMLARIGMLSWSTTETFTENGGSNVSKDEDTGSTALMGVGFEYDVYSLDHFRLRTEFTRAQVDNDELPVMGLNGSLVFRY